MRYTTFSATTFQAFRLSRLHHYGSPPFHHHLHLHQHIAFQLWATFRLPTPIMLKCLWGLISVARGGSYPVRFGSVLPPFAHLLLHPPARSFTPLATLQVAAAVGVGRRALRVATPGECVSVYGFAPGTLPPFGHPNLLPVLVDAGLEVIDQSHKGNTEGSREPHGASETVDGGVPAAEAAALSSLYCGSGVAEAVVEVSYQQLLTLSGGRPVDIADDSLAAEAAAAATPAVDAPVSAVVTALSGLEAASPSPGAAAATAVTAVDTGAGGGGVAGGSTAVETVMAGAGGGGAAPTRFLLDSMLGRLCRWLRCLGLDAEYVGRMSPGKAELARLTAKAAREGRIFLTRDQRLAERRDVAAPYVLHSDDAAAQLDELVRHFNVRFDEALVMSRCNACNAAAFQLISPREAARELVPPRVFQLVEEFWRCGCCGKVFWMGPKSASAIALVGGMLARSRRPEEPTMFSFFNDGYDMASISHTGHTASPALVSRLGAAAEGEVVAATATAAAAEAVMAGGTEASDGDAADTGAGVREGRSGVRELGEEKGASGGANPVAMVVVAAAAAAATAAAAVAAMAAPRWAAAAAAAAAATAVAATATEATAPVRARSGVAVSAGVDSTATQEGMATGQVVVSGTATAGSASVAVVSAPGRQLM
ncbi:hypothetical protein Vretimale_16204 [Volvox reticuliferus]|uniref:Mut7-C RNAse domain-containing protein n=1 Tax=Volvox reticuliferus TaxID=1737510 RepID=A0A8J4LX16_9CHLO|nr:hypothetical protein Vretimale_16204 [Volvox reticuliferus]